jgi:hypothetical protein
VCAGQKPFLVLAAHQQTFYPEKVIIFYDVVILNEKYDNRHACRH